MYRQTRAYISRSLPFFFRPPMIISTQKFDFVFCASSFSDRKYPDIIRAKSFNVNTRILTEAQYSTRSNFRKNLSEQVLLCNCSYYYCFHTIIFYTISHLHLSRSWNNDHKQRDSHREPYVWLNKIFNFFFFIIRIFIRFLTTNGIYPVVCRRPRRFALKFCRSFQFRVSFTTASI